MPVERLWVAFDWSVLRALATSTNRHDDPTPMWVGACGPKARHKPEPYPDACQYVSDCIAIASEATGCTRAYGRTLRDALPLASRYEDGADTRSGR